MSRRHSFLKVGLASVAAAALALVVSVPASAHSGSLFTAVGGDETFLATISKTDAALTPVGAPFAGFVAGLEIVDETGYALVNDSIVTWDHTTGEQGTPVTLVAAPGYTLFGTPYELDATSDGTLLAHAILLADATGPILTNGWIVSIDPLTGIVTPEVNTVGLGPDRNAIATNPVTGITYVFFGYNSSQYVALDVEAGSYGPASTLTGISAGIGQGFFGGADFDTSGTLWFYYVSDSTILASTTGEFGPGVGAVSSGSADVNFSVLATDPGGDIPAGPAQPAAAPALPNMGLEIGDVIALIVALLGAGTLALLIVRRRTA